MIFKSLVYYDEVIIYHGAVVRITLRERRKRNLRPKHESSSLLRHFLLFRGRAAEKGNKVWDPATMGLGQHGWPTHCGIRVPLI